MCSRVWLRRDDGVTVEASTRGELRALLAVEPVYDDAQWPARSDDDCLCSCDVPATAARAGFAAKQDDWGDIELSSPVNA